MNPNNAAKAIPVIAGAGIAIAGTISAPLLFAGALGLVAMGGMCAILGGLANNSKEGTIKLNHNGFEGDFKK